MCLFARGVGAAQNKNHHSFSACSGKEKLPTTDLQYSGMVQYTARQLCAVALQVCNVDTIQMKTDRP